MALSVAPPQPHIEMTVHRVTLLGVGGVCLVGLRPRKLHVAIGAEPLQDSVESLLGPLKLLAKAGDEDPGAALADLVVGGPELPTQGLRGDEPGQLFLVIEPHTQRFTQSGVA
jgi:hypothetical protein